MERGERELGEREGKKRRGEEGMKEQKDWDKERIENKKRDTIIEGAILDFKRNLELDKCPEIYKDDPN